MSPDNYYVYTFMSKVSHEDYFSELGTDFPEGNPQWVNYDKMLKGVFAPYYYMLFEKVHLIK